MQIKMFGIKIVEINSSDQELLDMAEIKERIHELETNYPTDLKGMKQFVVQQEKERAKTLQTNWGQLLSRLEKQERELVNVKVSTTGMQRKISESMESMEEAMDRLEAEAGDLAALKTKCDSDNAISQIEEKIRVTLKAMLK